MEGEHSPRTVGFKDTLWEMVKLCWKSQPNLHPGIEDVLQCLEGLSETLGLSSSEVDGEMMEDSHSELDLEKGFSKVPQGIYVSGKPWQIWEQKPSILFFTQGCLGVKLLDAVNGKTKGINNGNVFPFDADCTGITIRVHVGTQGYLKATTHLLSPAPRISF